MRNESRSVRQQWLPGVIKISSIILTTNLKTRTKPRLFRFVLIRGPDRWTAFLGGILIAICGGALLIIAPWLGGAFVAAGYGLTAYSLRGARSRFAASLRFAFMLFAMIGAAITTIDCLVPRSSWAIIDYLGKKLPLFIGVAILPWVIGIAKYLLAVIGPSPAPQRSRRAANIPRIERRT